MGRTQATRMFPYEKHHSTSNLRPLNTRTPHRQARRPHLMDRTYRQAPKLDLSTSFVSFAAGGVTSEDVLDLTPGGLFDDSLRFLTQVTEGLLISGRRRVVLRTGDAAHREDTDDDAHETQTCATHDCPPCAWMRAFATHPP